MAAGRLKDKVVVVTASTDGIGYAIAERLCSEGARVVVSSRKAANVDRAVGDFAKRGFQVIGVPCHVSNAEQRQALIAATVQKWGKIDALVSNAAVSTNMGPMLDFTEKEWDKIFDVNVKAAFLLAKEAVPHMAEGASIVFVSSIAAYDPSPFLGIYSVSKTALLGLTHALSRELAPLGIRVNCLAPGIVKTRFSQGLWENEELASSRVPMGRLATADEMGGTVAYLISADASYVTGETIVAAGGMQSRL